MSDANEGLYDLVEVDPATSELIQAEINAVLARYNAEIGVRSSIQVWKRVLKNSIPSPFVPPNTNGNETTTA